MDPVLPRYYRHIDGGLYRSISLARHADDGSLVMVYEHLWPFEPGVWVRDKDEFELRFLETSEAAYVAAMQGDREQARQAVQNAKASRRSQEKSL